MDFVLAYDPTSKIGQKKRDIYEQELIRAGLKLDYAQSVRKQMDGAPRFELVDCSSNPLKCRRLSGLILVMPVLEAFFDQQIKSPEINLAQD